MKTLIVSSSLSPNSKSFILCQTVYNKFKEKGVSIEIIDARNLSLSPYHATRTNNSMQTLSDKIEKADNIIIGMGVHCYSINDSLKIILDNCFEGAYGKLFGVICAAGGEKSYLSTSHLTQICMNEWRMIQLPRIIYATSKDFNESKIISKDINNRIEVFSNEFISIGKKLI
tara:strand:+ start:22 stop:537 length:516 start_codon:yes stop_codon:yes gene_type:complete